MHCEEAPALPILDKSWLFLPLPKDPEKTNGRYLQCPATGQVYCMSTGSLYCNISQINSLTTNIPSLNQRKDSCSFLSNPILCTMKKPVNTKNTDQLVHGNNASPISRAESDKSTDVKNADQSVQGNRASTTQSNKALTVKNAEKHKQEKPTPNTLSSKTPKARDGAEPSLGSNAAITPQNPSKTSSNIKSSTDPATKKQTDKVKKNRTTKNKCDHAQKKQKNCQPKSKNITKKQNKPTVLPQPKPTISFIINSSNIEHPIPKTRITPPALPSTLNPVIENQSKARNHSGYNPFLNSRSKLFRYHIITFKPMAELTRPFEMNLNHLLFPQSAAYPPINIKVIKKSDTKFQACSPFNSMIKYSSKATEKPSLNFSREDRAMIDFTSSFRKKPAKRKASVKMSHSFSNIWRIGQPFNRRPHHHYNRNRRSLMGQYRNCIMASSVHEIIHSRFARNTNEQMPESQIRAMLSAGDRKLRTRQRWIQCMEEEAIHKYKELKHKQNLQVEEYDVLHHPEKSWLVSYGRWVINRTAGESWSLLVKCLDKYPDSTLRQASKHRSFCLSWNGTSYTLRIDHAYYTQIQCHMAVTDTSYAELVVHTRKETTVLPVYFDFAFWKQTEETLDTFYTSNILPYLEKSIIAPTGKVCDRIEK